MRSHSFSSYLSFYTSNEIRAFPGTVSLGRKACMRNHGQTGREPLFTVQLLPQKIKGLHIKFVY